MNSRSFLLIASMITMISGPLQAQESKAIPPKSSEPAKTKARSAPAPTPAKPKVTPSRSGSKISDEPKLLSAEESARRQQMLRALGSEGSDDRYDTTNWLEVPAWRQTTFYGVRAKGQTFVYVVDCSGSMADEDRLNRAKRELRRSVMTLQFPQRFKVIFYNDQPLPMPGDLPKSADGLSKDQLNTWLRLIEADGGTDPRLALKLALALKPDAIFLLSDGAFPDGTATEIVGSNKIKTPIHCIDLSGGAGGDQLKKIASASGGRYVARP